jgi:hypothetical protein
LQIILTHAKIQLIALKLSTLNISDNPLLLFQRHFLDMLFLIENDSSGEYFFSLENTNGLLNYSMWPGASSRHEVFSHALETQPISIGAVYDRLLKSLSTLSLDSADDDSGYYVSADEMPLVDYFALQFFFTLFPGCVFRTQTNPNLDTSFYNHNPFNYIDVVDLIETHPKHRIFYDALFSISRSIHSDNHTQSMLLDFYESWPASLQKSYHNIINYLKSFRTLPSSVDISTCDYFFLQPDVFRYSMHLHKAHANSSTEAINHLAVAKIQRLIAPWEQLVSKQQLLKNNQSEILSVKPLAL